MGIFKLNGVDYMGGGGGGGNANEQVLTWAEYCALTPEEKMNDTTYYINDINGDGQSFQPVIFSFEEREIGVWTDGKPLYQKTITANGLSGVSDWTPLDASVSYDTLVSVDGQRFDNNQKFSFTNGMETAPRFQTKNDGKLYYFTNYTISGDMYITIRYTKTTDQPGSGTWTPQGIPAVHYDGNEKVVGTWFGETLYEKTYTANLEVNNSNWTSTGIEVGDIDKAISVVAGNNVGTCWNALFCAVDQTYIRLTSPRNGDTISVNWFTLRYTKSTS